VRDARRSGNPLLATKSIDQLRSEADAAHGLKRTLGPWDLVMLGIGAIIGAGLFRAHGRRGRQTTPARR